jgi:hypothetical protein
MNIGESIVADHINGLKPLDKDQFNELKKLLEERVVYFRSVKNFQLALLWTDVLLKLLGSQNDDPVVVLASLWKADSLLNMGRSDESLTLSHQCMLHQYSTQTLLMTFKCALGCRRPEEAVLIVINGQRKHVNTLTSNRPDVYEATARFDDLDRLILCASYLRDQSESIENNEALCLILEEWLSQYLLHNMWKIDDLLLKATEQVQSSGRISFLEIVIELFSSFLKVYARCEAIKSLDEIRPLSNQECQMDFSIFQKDVDGSLLCNSSSNCINDSDKGSKDVRASDTQNSGDIGTVTLTNSHKLEAFGEEVSRFSTKDAKSALEILAHECTASANYGADNPQNTSYASQCSVTEFIFAGSTVESIHFKCTTKRIEILQGKLRDAIILCKDIKLNLIDFKKDNSLLWIAHMCWNIGKLLLNEKSSTIDAIYPVDAIALIGSSATFFEAAADYYACITPNDPSTPILNEILSIIVAISARINLDAELYVNSDKLQVYHSDKEKLSNMTRIESNVARAKRLLRAYSTAKELRTDSDKALQSSLVMLEFTFKCRICANSGESKLEEYFNQTESSFFELSAPDLIKCANICLKERGGNVYIARRILSLAIQVLNRTAHLDYALIGSLYKRIIKLSPSRHEVI